MDEDLKALLAQLLNKINTIQTDVSELRVGQRILQTGQDALQAGQDEIRADVTALQIGQESLRAGQDEIRADVAALQIGQESLRAGQESLRADVAALQSGQDDIRRVTSTNHFRLMGRIEQLSDQILKHIAEPGHGLAPRGPEAAVRAVLSPSKAPLAP